MGATAGLKKVTQGFATKTLVTHLPLNALRPAADAPPELGLEVRKSEDAAAFAELLASVRAYGVIVPLVVKKTKNHIFVIGGNRRLRALCEIHGAESDWSVPTIDANDFRGDPREIAMATNVALPPHPVERYEMISVLIDAGMKPADAKARFAMSDRQFAQVMALGGLHPTIREAWKKGRIDAGVARKFTLAADQKQQAETFVRLSKNDNLDAWNVGQALMPAKVRNVGPMLEAVGAAEYEKAGGKVTLDLFGTDHRVSDLKLLAKMVSEKVQAECERLVKEEGWAWALPESEVSNPYEYGDVSGTNSWNLFTREEKARVQEIERLQNNGRLNQDEWEKLENETGAIEQAALARAWTPDMRKKSGCFVKIDSKGLAVTRGKVKPDEARRARAAERAGEAKKKRDKAGAEGKPAGVTSALMDRMTQALTEAARQTIPKTPHFTMLAALVAGFNCTHDVVRVSTAGYVPDGERHNFERGDFDKALAKTLGMSNESLMTEVGKIVARALDLHSYSADRGGLANESGSLAFCNALPPMIFAKEMRKRFDYADYFKSVPLALCATALAECGFTAKVPGKKADAAALAAKEAAAKGWLPPQLRWDGYDGPRAIKKAKPRAKAAGKRKQAKKGGRRGA